MLEQCLHLIFAPDDVGAATAGAVDAGAAVVGAEIAGAFGVVGAVQVLWLDCWPFAKFPRLDCGWNDDRALWKGRPPLPPLNDR